MKVRTKFWEGKYSNCHQVDFEAAAVTARGRLYSHQKSTFRALFEKGSDHFGGESTLSVHLASLDRV